MAKSGPPLVPITDRFWPKVRKTKGCWLWTAKTNNMGYGLIGGGGTHGGFVLAHRLSWELANGPIPPGKNVLHDCDNPLCIRPDHLKVGSQGDNMKDMRKKGRHKFVAHLGEANGQSKLTEDDVREIRRIYSAGGVTQKELAELFGISQALVGFVVTRRAWSHVA